jgi:hypothetical protein
MIASVSIYKLHDQRDFIHERERTKIIEHERNSFGSVKTFMNTKTHQEHRRRTQLQANAIFSPSPLFTGRDAQKADCWKFILNEQ